MSNTALQQEYLELLAHEEKHMQDDWGHELTLAEAIELQRKQLDQWSWKLSEPCYRALCEAARERDYDPIALVERVMCGDELTQFVLNWVPT